MVTDRGVIYYNRGTKCLVRLCVSIQSLRKFWDGPVCLLWDGAELPGWVERFIGRYNVEDIHIGPADEGRSALVRKASLWRSSPFCQTMYLDADTVVVAPIDEFFGHIQKFGLVVHNFCGWKTGGGTIISKRIRAWSGVVDDHMIEHAIHYGKAVNTGVMGWCWEHDNALAFLKQWETLTNEGYEARCTRIMVDELACQLLLPSYRHKMLGQEWGLSMRYGAAEQPKIYHFHGRKHTKDYPRCETWKYEYWELRNPLSSNDYELHKPHGDRRLRDYLKDVVKTDVTIVTAVNPEYLDKLRKNFPEWQRTPGLREQQYLVFVNRIKLNDPRLDFLRQSNVRLLKWRFPPAGDNVRERMLSAFVFGVAEHVKTEYWMKLDADVRVKNGVFEWPNYREYTLTSHRWGYTRVKGDPGQTQHWLNRLDDYFGIDAQQRFPEIEPWERHRHKRTAGFAAIERTEETRKYAITMQKTHRRLVIPSADTVSWYWHNRFGNVNRINFKQWLSP